MSITVLLDGRPFDHVRLDVVARLDEVDGGTEQVTISPPVAGLSFGPSRVRAVDVGQHAAEKFHALCRTYAGDRPSTRVKDLLDVVLLVEAGLLPDARTGDRLRAVFLARDGAEPPSGLPVPPSSWEGDYTTLSAQTSSTCRGLSEAFALAARTYEHALRGDGAQGR